jgi:hypothetical protein
METRDTTGRDNNSATPKTPTPKFRLAIQAVPKPLWGRNKRTTVGKAGWRKAKGDAPAACQICKRKALLSGHEVWEYEEKRTTGVARLMGVQHICQDCHSIIHFGRTSNLYCSGALTKKEFFRVIQHFLTVNDCDMTVFKRHFDEARKDWERRSKLKWTIDVKT